MSNIKQKFCQTFAKITKNDTKIAGGKGASLGEMTKAGIPVPEGFVLLAGAFDRFLQETDLLQEIESAMSRINYDDINSVDKASLMIRNLIDTAQIPDDLAVEILSAYNNLDQAFVAVRSSATLEDSKSASWAGELESYLNATEETLIQNVKKCWSSLFTPRAIFYRKEKDFHKTHVSVAVVVQKMIQSEVSGITFTVHPVTEDPKQMIIEACWGLGEAIVSGSVTPDSYVVNKEDWTIIDININAQKKELVRVEGVEKANDWQELDEKKQCQQILPNDQIIELAKLCQKIEKHYDSPQDIEWAIQGSKLYITQSRPITTL